MVFLLTSPPVPLRKARATDPLTAAADAAVPRVRRWWEELWNAFQGALPLTWALSSLETVLRQAWHGVVLPRILGLDELLDRLAQAVARVPIPPLPVDALGITQAITAIETSLAQVPTTMAQLPPALLPDVAVLTIPQQGALVRMAEGLAAAEARLTPAHVERTLRTQARAQLVTRTTGLAGQLTWQAAQAGQQAGWQQQAQRGALGAGVRRFWVTTPSACSQTCAPIPGMNLDGVGLDEPFQSPIGPIFAPTAHPHCRCGVRVG